MKVVGGFHSRKTWKLVLAAQSNRRGRFADHHTNFGVIANGHNVFNRLMIFQGHLDFKSLGQKGQHVGLSPVHVLSGRNEQSIPQGVNQSRTQEFQTPLTRLIRVTLLDVLGQHFAHMGSGMSRKCTFLKISNRTGIADLHYFWK